MRQTKFLCLAVTAFFIALEPLPAKNSGEATPSANPGKQTKPLAQTTNEIALFDAKGKFVGGGTAALQIRGIRGINAFKKFSVYYYKQLTLEGGIHIFDLPVKPNLSSMTMIDFTNHLRMVEKVFMIRHQTMYAEAREDLVRDTLIETGIMASATGVMMLMAVTPFLLPVMKVAGGTMANLVAQARKRTTTPDPTNTSNDDSRPTPAPTKTPVNKMESLFKALTSAAAADQLIRKIVDLVEERSVLRTANATSFLRSVPELSLLVEYLAYRELILPSLRERIDRQIDQDLQRMEAGIIERNSRLLIETARSSPVIRAPLSYDEAGFDREFASLAPAVRHDLKQLGFSEYLSNQILLSGQRPLQIQFPAYLVGDPGTGKTASAKRMASLLGTTLCEVSLDGASNDEIFGTERYRGRLLEALLARNPEQLPVSHNRILFIDEFDRLLNSDTPEARALLPAMLKLLDPDGRQFYSPYLQASFPLPDTIVLAGNFDLNGKVSDTFEALESRLRVIPFSGFTKDGIRKIIFGQLIPEYLEKLKRAENTQFLPDQLSEGDKRKILAYIESSQDHGLRSAQKFALRVVDEALQKAYSERKRP